MGTEVARLTSRIGPRSAGLLMTADEFDALPESRRVKGFRYELINQVLVVSPPPSPSERGANDVLGYLLRNYREKHPAGACLDETFPEETLPTTPNRRRCDRAVWVGLGYDPDSEVDVPAIVVEFVSARKRDFIRDYETKRDEYGRFGVREYWVIDRFRRIMTVYRFLPGAESHRTLIVGEADEYRTDLLPGFSLSLRRLLPQAGPPRQRRPRRDRN
jgi:Uma2 family endonuclease